MKNKSVVAVVKTQNNFRLGARLEGRWMTCSDGLRLEVFWSNGCDVSRLYLTEKAENLIVVGCGLTVSI